MYHSHLGTLLGTTLTCCRTTCPEMWHVVAWLQVLTTISQQQPFGTHCFALAAAGSRLQPTSVLARGEPGRLPPAHSIQSLFVLLMSFPVTSAPWLLHSSAKGAVCLSQKKVRRLIQSLESLQGIFGTVTASLV